MPLLIFDGPRAAGKTTMVMRLQESLAKERQVTVLKTPRSYSWMPEQYVSTIHGMLGILEVVSQANPFIIIDRFIGTEIVMRQLDGSATHQFTDTLYMLETFILEKKIPHLQLYLHAPENLRMARVPDRSFESGVTDISLLWKAWSLKTRLKTVSIDASREQDAVFDDVEKNVIQWMDYICNKN